MLVYFKRYNVYIYICGNGVIYIDFEGNVLLFFIYIYIVELVFFL